MSAKFKAQKVLAPLAHNLAPAAACLRSSPTAAMPGSRSCSGSGRRESLQVDRHQLLAALRDELGRDARNYTLTARPDDKAVFRYHMHTLPSEIGDRIGTSTLFAAWNAAIYVNQIEDERLDAVIAGNNYLEATQSVLATRRAGSTTRPSSS